MNVSYYTPTTMHRIRSKLNQLTYMAGDNWRGFCDWLKWLGHKPGNLERHAEKELRLAGAFDKSSFYGGMMGPAVLRMVREFSQEGHSGMSAGLAVSMFKKAASFEPLTPLTGEDSEWHHVHESTYQNVRCSRVFKDENGAYDIDGRVFRYPSGCCYTGRDSRVPVKFPYTPTTEYVDVPEQP